MKLYTVAGSASVQRGKGAFSPFFFSYLCDKFAVRDASCEIEDIRGLILLHNSYLLRKNNNPATDRAAREIRNEGQ